MGQCTVLVSLLGLGGAFGAGAFGAAFGLLSVGFFLLAIWRHSLFGHPRMERGRRYVVHHLKKFGHLW